MTLYEIARLLADMTDNEDHKRTTGEGKLPPRVVGWFNACSSDITEPARLKGMAEMEYDPAIEVVGMPKDFYRPVRRGFVWFEDDPVPRVGMLNNTRYGYRLWGDQLYFQGLEDEGKITIYYYRKIPKFEGKTDEEPVIPEQFHELYALYGAMRNMQMERDEMEAKRDFQEEYEIKKEELRIHRMQQDDTPYPRGPEYIERTGEIIEKVRW